MPYIAVDQLSKTFTVRKKREKGRLTREKTAVHALQGVSFSVEQGELVGYIGPNGAGKSTTVKILSGILTPDGGSALVGGRVPWQNRKEHVRRIGVVFGQRSQLWWDVPFLRTPLRLLSLGQRMRAELAGSLLHSPELLFLDEPTIGLDAVSKLALRDFLKYENEKNGTTILLTTHDMEDIAALCRRVMVLGHGKKLYDGDLPELLSRYDTQRVITLRYDGGAALPPLPDGCQVSREGADYKIAYSPQALPTARLLTLLQSAGSIRELTAQPENIDHLIAAMYREMGL